MIGIKSVIALFLMALCVCVAADAVSAPRRLGGKVFAERKKSPGVVTLISAENKGSAEDESSCEVEKEEPLVPPTDKKWDKFTIERTYADKAQTVFGIIIGVVSPTQATEFSDYIVTSKPLTYYMIKTHKGEPCCVRAIDIKRYVPGEGDHFKLRQVGYGVYTRRFEPESEDEFLKLPIFVQVKDRWKRLVVVDKKLTSKFADDERERLRRIKQREDAAAAKKAEEERIAQEKKEAKELKEKEAKEREERLAKEREERALAEKRENERRERLRPHVEAYKKAYYERNALSRRLDRLDPRRSCPVHKWQEDLAPRFKGDFQTAQSKNEYARNYMEALRAQKDGILTCSCNEPEILKAYNECKAKFLEAADKMDEVKRQHPEIDFPKEMSDWGCE